jgi:hypothetical protein
VRQKLESKKICNTEYKDKLGHREDWGDYWRIEKTGEGLVESDPKHTQMLRTLEPSERLSSIKLSGASSHVR